MKIKRLIYELIILGFIQLHHNRRLDAQLVATGVLYHFQERQAGTQLTCNVS